MGTNILGLDKLTSFKAGILGSGTYKAAWVVNS
jgi:hypothetical protein